MTPVERQRLEIADTFVAQRPRLRSIAYRMLGSHHDAEDAVQETWLRLDRANVAEIDNLDAWLTTVVSRVCIDQLRSSATRHEDVDADLADLPTATTPEDAAIHDDDICTAMMVVLEELQPLERLAFVLHDMFGLSFDLIAPIVSRSPAAARQLASRARRRVRGVNVTAERSRRNEAVTAFLKASRHGDFGTLLQLLDPEVKLHADAAAVASAAPHADEGAPLLQGEVTGADAVARIFQGRAGETQIAIVDGVPGAAYVPGGTPHAVYTVMFDGSRITRIEVLGNPAILNDITVDLT